jgi:methionyl-tRNA formyltransferase
MAVKKIILLCNNKIALPALKELIFFKQVSAILVPANNKEVIADVKDFIAESKSDTPLLLVTKNNFSTTINEAIATHQPMAVIMMTFPFIIAEDILVLPPKGFINFHYGKLPQYRGAEPVFTQVLLQEKEPALTVHVVDKGIDSGGILLQEIFEYNEDDTYASLQNKLANAGAKVIGSVIKILSFGKYIPSIPQDECKAAYHSKPTAADLMIDWQTMTSHQIKALVNACNPWNKGCGAKINNTVFGITEVEILDKGLYPILKAGTIACLNYTEGLLVFTSDEKLIKINIIYTKNGFESGYKLKNYGVNSGDVFQKI